MGLREEILLDVQTPTHTGNLTFVQQRMVELVTKATVGTMIVWGAIVEIKSEVRKYKAYKGE